MARPLRWRSTAAVIVAAVLLAGGCSSEPDGATSDRAEPASERTPASTAVDDYPDAITRELTRLAEEPRPVEPSAMPPRHLDRDAFPTALVDRERIVWGGAPPDGISPIDEPAVEPADAVDWVAAAEPVLVLAVDDDVRAYPLQVLIWHEIVNDVVGGVPVAVTYCPLCNSGIVFGRTVGSDVLDFGTSGSLYQANLVMYDRQTESLWTQFDGRSVVGTRVGDRLDVLPSSVVSFGEFRDAHPSGDVLARDAERPKPYGSNPYGAYDQRTATLDGFFTGEPDATLPPYARVVGVEVGGRALAVPTSSLRDVGVVETTVAGTPLTIWHRPGTVSALNADLVAEGADVGATGVFRAEVDGTAASFEPVADGVVDDVTGTTWSLLGIGIDGPLAGRRLERIAHVDTFWFSWATFRPDGALLDPRSAGAEVDADG